MDPNNPLLNPKTEEEWYTLFSKIPTYAPQGGFMLVENTRITVIKRENDHHQNWDFKNKMRINLMSSGI